MTHQHLYVYYRVTPADAAALRDAVQRMQDALRLTQGQTTYALRRRTTLDESGLETWMEIYENVTPGFEAMLNAVVEQAGLMQWISSPRHTECFEG